MADGYLAVNTAYSAWLPYRLHREGHKGIPLDGGLKFLPTDRKPESDGVTLWANIGTVITDADGCIPFARQIGESFPLDKESDQ